MRSEYAANQALQAYVAGKALTTAQEVSIGRHFTSPVAFHRAAVQARAANQRRAQRLEWLRAAPYALLPLSIVAPIVALFFA